MRLHPVLKYGLLAVPWVILLVGLSNILWAVGAGYMGRLPIGYEPVRYAAFICFLEVAWYGAVLEEYWKRTERTQKKS